MATQGMVTIIKDGKVVAKVVAGCNGAKAKDVAKSIVEHLVGIQVALLQKIAEIHSLGCESCLVVTVRQGDAIRIVVPDDEDYVVKATENTGTQLVDHYVRTFDIKNFNLVDHYVRTFDIKNFNPRWAQGVASHIWIANLDKQKAYGVGCYKGEPIE